jgi:uncharacterized membrane protein YoaK (UPF0700 family)
MDRLVSSNHVTDPDLHREETLAVAALALAGGYIDAYSWITHRVFANAQTANMLFLWINAMEGAWAKALHYLPSLTAFVIGVIMACWLRRVAGAAQRQSAFWSKLPFLFWSEFCTTGFPARPERSAFPSSPAMQAASFPRVEAWSYKCS